MVGRINLHNLFDIRDDILKKLLALLLLSPLVVSEDVLIKCDGFGRDAFLSVIINISDAESWIETPNYLTNINNNVSSAEQELQTKRRNLTEVSISDEKISATFKVRFGHYAKLLIDRYEGTVLLDQRRFRFQGDCSPYEAKEIKKRF